MVEQELKEIWRNSSQMENIKFDLSRLLMEFHKKAANLDKVIRKRDMREIGASVFGIILFGYFAYELPFWVSKVGCSLSIGWFVYIVYKFRNNRKTKLQVDLTLPFKVQLERQQKNIKQEAHFLNSVFYWYVLPPFIANLIIIFGAGDPSLYDWNPRLDLLPITLESKITMICFLALFSGFVVWLNKRAVKKTLNPIIDEINRIQEQLDNEE